MPKFSPYVLDRVSQLAAIDMARQLLQHGDDKPFIFEGKYDIDGQEVVLGPVAIASPLTFLATQLRPGLRSGM